MPFGLKNAPTVFQCMIDTVLESVSYCTEKFVDDILVYSTNEEQRKKDLIAVFECLQKANLFLKPSKCKFFREEVSFLGNLVLKDGYAVLPDKALAISSWPTPQS